MKTLLALDSLVKFLTQHERIIAIKRSLNQDFELTCKMEKALDIIKKFHWIPPKTKIGQDRVTRFYNDNSESWELLEKYDHPIINEIQKLK